MSFGTLHPDVGPRFVDIGLERSITTMYIVEAGWRRAMGSESVSMQSGEVEITECLREGMRAELNERTGTWCKRTTILPGTESRSSSATSKPDGRTDIPIYFQEVRETFDDHDPHAIIECKRVAGQDAALCRLYVVDGIDRFARGKYAERHAVAFMAGYVLSGTVGAVTSRINRYLSGRGRAAEHLNPCTVLAQAWARSSRHPRHPPAAPIELHHAFLTVQAVP